MNYYLKMMNKSYKIYTSIRTTCISRYNYLKSRDFTTSTGTLETNKDSSHVNENIIQTNDQNNILYDKYGRFHNYLRISLTEKCNLRCMYCMPHEGIHLTEKSKLLTLDERMRLISIFSTLGVTKLRFTGGEPTISNQLLPLVRHAKDCGIKSIGITTNGLELGRNKNRLDELVKNGLTSINISLDSLNPMKFAQITRRDDKNLYSVLSCIYHAISFAEVHVKVNCVLMKGINDDEILDFTQISKDTPVDVRFIEIMPFEGNEWSPSQLMSYKEAVTHIESQSIDNGDKIKLIEEGIMTRNINDTTKWYQPISSDGVPYLGKIGFISSMTR